MQDKGASYLPLSHLTVLQILFCLSNKSVSHWFGLFNNLCFEFAYLGFFPGYIQKTLTRMIMIQTLFIEIMLSIHSCGAKIRKEGQHFLLIKETSKSMFLVLHNNYTQNDWSNH